MNVLVVDDLYEVVHSVIDGVDWAAMGIGQVFGAYSVEEAKAILGRNSIQLLLCDIEMPPSSGFDLLEWMRAQGVDAECIFLTSHAEFEYARMAVKLGSFDYILQPARREDIEAAVRRALARIEEKHRTQDAAQYGEYWQRKKHILADACAARFLSSGGKDLDGFLEDLKRLGIALGRSTQVCPILVQLHRASQDRDSDALRALFMECLGRTERTLLLVRLAESCHLALLFGGDSLWAELASQLAQLSARWTDAGLGQRPACYVGEIVLPEDLYAQWLVLRDRMRDNVAQYSGVFVPMQKTELLHYVYTFPDMHRWVQLLEAGQCRQVQEEALTCLNQQREQGKLNAEFLAKFHQDFIQTFFTAAQARQLSTRDVFFEEYPFNDFIQAYTSYEKMISLVRFATDYLAANPRPSKPSESPVREAIQYIRQNIEKDLHRSDVADAIFMNSDHLSRLFKKETGVSMYDFIISEKMRVAESLLIQTNLPVSLVASKVGYSNFSYFSQAFKRQTGMTPGEYRSAHQ